MIFAVCLLRAAPSRKGLPEMKVPKKLMSRADYRVVVHKSRRLSPKDRMVVYHEDHLHRLATISAQAV